jgi:hypothetical protein
MSDHPRSSVADPRSVAECLDELHHNIEGMVKVPRLPSALRLMLIVAHAQVDELRAAIERDLPSGPSEASFTRPVVRPR